jgi:hypothetical protein
MLRFSCKKCSVYSKRDVLRGFDREFGLVVAKSWPHACH